MSSKKHDFTVTEIKAGFLVLVSITVLLLFFAIVQGMRPPEELNRYYATFADTGGLNPGAAVRFGGLKVGRVSRIAPDEEDRSLIRVEFTVKKNVPVNSESIVSIAQTTLMSEKHIEISTGAPDAALAASGSHLPSKAGNVLEQIGVVAENVNHMIEDVGALLGVEARKHETDESGAPRELVTIADIFAGVDGTVGEGKGMVQDLRDIVADARSDIETILSKLQEIEDNAKTVTGAFGDVIQENRSDVRASVEDIRKTVAQLSAMADMLSGRLETISASLEAALSNTDHLSGDVRAIVENNQTVIEDTIVDLRETVRNLKSFSRTMAEQPDSVLWGHAPQGRR